MKVKVLTGHNIETGIYQTLDKLKCENILLYYIFEENIMNACIITFLLFLTIIGHERKALIRIFL